MYIPAQFEETRPEVLHELLRTHPLATIITHPTQGLSAQHIPLYFRETPTPFGTLQGHISRHNPLCEELKSGADTLVIFHGPHAYITPSWYPTKRETGMVVPTWNYAVVHVTGHMTLQEDPAWLMAHLGSLTEQQEQQVGSSWKVEDAPPEYLQKMLQGIVGIEIAIHSLVGKWKMSQNQPRNNQEGVVEGLTARHTPETQATARMVQERMAGEV